MTIFAMATFLRARVDAGGRSEQARRLVADTVRELEERLSFFRQSSDVSRVNAAAGSDPVKVGAETFAAVALALRYADLTDGAFDPAFRSRGCGRFREIELDARRRTVRLPRRGMLLDLGGIGKGFALDLALARARQAYPVESAVMDFGGQWLFFSRFAIRETVAIEDPRAEGRLLDTLTVEGNVSVSTSSQGQRPGHLRLPCSGAAASACLSATAVAATGAEAEALSTALFVAGPRQAERFLSRFPGAQARLHR